MLNLLIFNQFLIDLLLAEILGLLTLHSLFLPKMILVWLFIWNFLSVSFFLDLFWIYFTVNFFLWLFDSDPPSPRHAHFCFSRLHFFHLFMKLFLLEIDLFFLNFIFHSVFINLPKCWHYILLFIKSNRQKN